MEDRTALLSAALVNDEIVIFFHQENCNEYQYDFLSAMFGAAFQDEKPIPLQDIWERYSDYVLKEGDGYFVAGEKEQCRKSIFLWCSRSLYEPIRAQDEALAKEFVRQFMMNIVKPGIISHEVVGILTTGQDTLFKRDYRSLKWEVLLGQSRPRTQQIDPPTNE